MTDQPIGDGRARVLTVLLLLVVFVAGALTGAVTATSLHAEDTPAVTPVSGERPLAGLELSEDQRTLIEAILAKYQPAVDSVARASIADLRALMQEADIEVRAVLAPGQLEAYERLLAQQPRIRAVRRVMGPGATVVDTIR